MDKIMICNEMQCTGCGVCSEKCPKQCINMIENMEGFLYPSINSAECIHCGLCKKICPNNYTLPRNEARFYMAINKDRKVLKNSSSGGAFSGIAKLVFLMNGYVAGAYMDPVTKEIKHILIRNEADLIKLRMSKYYQSNPIGIYEAVIAKLKEDNYVLFSGTACQIAALLMIVPDKLKKKLITVDVLCHGVSSKKFVDKYIQSEEKRFKKKIDTYHFRIKEDNGWKSGGGTKMKLDFADGSSFIEKKTIDTFFMAFNKNLILRESCYSCRYCGIERISDFTIADFWGVTEERANIQMQHDGISVLICNSFKAKNLLVDLKEYLYIEKIMPEEVIPFNNALSSPNSRPKQRDLFIEEILSGADFSKTVKAMYRNVYLKIFIKSILGKKFIDRIKYIRRK